MRRLVNKIVKAFFNRIGFEIYLRKKASPNQATTILSSIPLQFYESFIKEYEQVFFELTNHELPLNDHRPKLMAQLQGTGISEGFHILSYLHKAIKIQGEICEFGVAQGATSALMASHIMHTDKHLYLFDSFEGLPAPTDKDILIDDIWGLGSIEAYTGLMSVPMKEVLARLNLIQFPLERTHIIAGFIEETIHTAQLPESVCFAYIDFDFYEPIKIALEFLSSTLSQGGYVVVDDYGFFSAGAKTAVDEFVAGHDGFKLILPPDWAGKFVILEKV